MSRFLPGICKGCGAGVVFDAKTYSIGWTRTAPTTTARWFNERFPTLIERARTICMRCEVRVDCQSHAMEEKIDYGVWGGLTAEERAKARNARKRARR